MTWKSIPRNSSGKDTGSIYVLPRTPEGLVKIGYRGIKVGRLLSAIKAVILIGLSSPTSNQRQMERLTRRMANGQFPFHRQSACHYLNP